MLIAIGGRSGSGKTNVAKMLQQDIESVMIQSGGSTTSQSMSPSECVISLIPKKIIYIGMDNFYIETNGDMNADSDICLWRRIQRDVESRGRTINSCGKQFFNITKKGAIEFIIPTKKYADFILDNNYIDNLNELKQSNGYKTLLKYIKQLIK